MAGPMIRENPFTTLRLEREQLVGTHDQRTRHHGQRQLDTPHQQVEDMAASQQRRGIRKN
jgi:hypothetical protein